MFRFRLIEPDAMTVKCTARVEHDRFGPLKSPLAGQSTVVYIRRPSSIRIEIETTRRTPGIGLLATPITTFVADGEYQIEILGFSKAYVRKPCAATIDGLESAIVIPLALDLLFPFPEVLKELYSAQRRYQNGFTEFLGLRGAHVTYTRDLRVDTETGLPESVTFVVLDENEIEVQRFHTTFENWTIGPEFPPSLFDTSPPEGMFAL
jgi:hypothetical protein